MGKKEIALANLSKKFNCAQSVFSAFSEDVGIEKETALKASACFGGGMKCGEVCGAVTGVLMAIGMKYGSSTENDEVGQYLAYQKEMEFIRKFKEKQGKILCKELLGYDTSKPEEMQKAIQKGLHITVCAKAIADAVEIAEEIL